MEGGGGGVGRKNILLHLVFPLHSLSDKNNLNTESDNSPWVCILYTYYLEIANFMYMCNKHGFL